MGKEIESNVLFLDCETVADPAVFLFYRKLRPQ
jgi:hypothetical protein